MIADEMSVSEALSLNTKTMNVEGFVDTGPFTPENLQNTQATHVMVLMYRPLQGDWYQVNNVFIFCRRYPKMLIVVKLIVKCVACTYVYSNYITKYL